MRYLHNLTHVLSVVGYARVPLTQVKPPAHNNMNAIVTDIDGTLTPNVLAINKVRQDAVNAMNTLADKGYKIIYVTARVLLLQAGLPKWLQDNGFPEGALHIAQTHEDRSHPEIFKARILKDYIQKGWNLRYAFGDSSTDFAAYAEAGIPKERVFALRRRGSEICQQGDYQKCLEGWTEYLSNLEKEIATRKIHLLN